MHAKGETEWSNPALYTGPTLSTTQRTYLKKGQKNSASIQKMRLYKISSTNFRFHVRESIRSYKANKIQIFKIHKRRYRSSKLLYTQPLFCLDWNLQFRWRTKEDLTCPLSKFTYLFFFHCKVAASFFKVSNLHRISNYNLK